jgi:hypothetical protein
VIHVTSGHAEFRDGDSPRLAEIVSERTKRKLSAEAFRKQVSRARRLMADLILQEAGRGLGEPTADDVEAELAELGLWGYVADYLPDDWRTRFFSD